uniref:NADH-ubiquinone oxidoreductase chain 6 n=1 Tax=Bacidia sp. TaxID=2040699 RepID=A0A482JWA6_9LECA|nr:NADH dehydrogenase subunit 6 [Bacidia sp.]
MLFFIENLSYSDPKGYLGNSLKFFDAICVFTSICVIISKNPIVSVLYLIGLFLSISCHLLISGLNFIGLSYLLVYVGAVSILFLFILMLINIRISELLNNSTNIIPLGLIIAFLFNYPIYEILPFNNDILSNATLSFNPNNLLANFYSYNFYLNTDKPLYVSSKLWDGSLTQTTHITSIGDIMYTSYSIWLIITSIILLLAMVGAIVITIKQPQNNLKKNDVFNKYNNFSNPHVSTVSSIYTGKLSIVIVWIFFLCLTAEYA